MTLEIDHVIVCVQDLDQAGIHFETQFGLSSVPGGRHLGLGTANRVVPLGANYVELIAVVDEDEAKESPIGRWVKERARANSLHPSLLCLRSSDLDEVCRRLGLTPDAMFRIRPDGIKLSWRLAGLDQAIETGELPFFIEWTVPFDLRPGSEGGMRAGPITNVELSGDRELLTKWLGGQHPGLEIVEGPPGVSMVRIRREGGEIELRAVSD